MKQAQQSFQKGQYQKAIQLYTKQINEQKNKNNHKMSLLNLSSVYFTIGEYTKCMDTIKQYLQYFQSDNNITLSKQQQLPKVQSYILYCKCLIKLKTILSHQQHHIIQQFKSTYPYHKTLLQLISIIQQLQITQNQDQYLDRIFQKIMQHPKLRNYCLDQSFLTKVEKIIRNPSLAAALIKIDKRLENVMEVILMAQDQQGDKDRQGNKKAKQQKL